jgi:hypothetical protein
LCQSIAFASLQHTEVGKCSEILMRTYTMKVDTQSLQTEPFVANPSPISNSQMFQTPALPFTRPTNMTIIPSPYIDIATKKDAQRPIDHTLIVVSKSPKNRRSDCCLLLRKVSKTKNRALFYCFKNRDFVDNDATPCLSLYFRTINNTKRCFRTS